MGCNMEYKKLQKPLYWMGFVKGKFTKRKFIEYQVRYQSYYRADDGTVRQVTRYMEENIGKLHYYKGFEKLKKEFIDFEKDKEKVVVYGSIWTDKGLIYVAKMNDKGELELI